jgi:hypothetical protein
MLGGAAAADTLPGRFAGVAVGGIFLWLAFRSALAYRIVLRKSGLQICTILRSRAIPWAQLTSAETVVARVGMYERELLTVKLADGSERRITGINGPPKAKISDVRTAAEAIRREIANRSATASP